MPTGLVWHERYWRHDPGPGAGVLPAGPWVPAGEPIDSAEPKRRLKALLDASGLTQKLAPIGPREATDEELARVHARAYLARVREVSAAGGGEVGPMAHVGPGGYEIAALSAGGVIAAVDGVLAGRVSNAYAFVRPSGHHATAETGMGFCVFSNAAIGAMHALARHGLARVALVDWDVHHGNGAQAVFWNDPRVLTVSLHQDGTFPRATGSVAERGEGRGTGTNLNIPLPPGCGGAAYRAAFERVVLPALERFRPELIIVPCGYDAGFQDPLSRMMLGPEDFRWMAETIKRAAQSLCGGRLALCQEGGYSASTVPFLGLPVFEALSGSQSGASNPVAELFATIPHRGLLAHQEAAVEAARQEAGL
jgi:acetoin utilization deacetylase AcuC-like enzyme